MESEKKIFEMMNKKAAMSKYWMPLVWATNIINRARKEQLITSDHVVQTLLVELSDIRKKLGGLIGYDTVCVPLVYTQVMDHSSCLLDFPHYFINRANVFLRDTFFLAEISIESSFMIHSIGHSNIPSSKICYIGAVEIGVKVFCYERYKHKIDKFTLEASNYNDSYTHSSQ